MARQTPETDPLEDIRSKISRGANADAISDIETMISRGVKDPAVHRLLAFAFLSAGESQHGLSEIAKARALQPNNASEEIAFGRMLTKEGHTEAALDCFTYAAKIEPENDDPLALVSMAYRGLGQTDEAVEWGQRCLDLRDAQASKTNVAPVERRRPVTFTAENRERNIIAFSLFGDDEYYWDGAIAAASMGVAMYPEWTCRFYCDPGIPTSILERLGHRRAQVMVSPTQSVNWSGLFWRFWAFDDPNADVVMIRDVDSPFTLRERLAVDEWLASDFPFHVIRDHISHTEPIMAGLWGGWTRLLPQIYPMVTNYLKETQSRYADQRFLRFHISPRLREAALVHDRYYRLGETRPVPAHATEAYSHIGGAWPKYRHGDAKTARA